MVKIIQKQTETDSLEIKPVYPYSVSYDEVVAFAGLKVILEICARPLVWRSALKLMGNSGSRLELLVEAWLRKLGL